LYIENFFTIDTIIIRVISVRQIVEMAQKLGAKVLVVKINEIEKIVYRNGKVYIVRDGHGIIHRRLWPRELSIVKERIERGEYYYK